VVFNRASAQALQQVQVRSDFCVTAYYNEFDPFAAAWLRELIAANLIAPGEVDTRSITKVQADDLRGFTQAHFFAGVGGWSHALRLAGWSDDRPVWTGSCPCQPFSAAGDKKGEADHRHLWPEFRRLIADCDPAIVFGEQVASPAGRKWLAGVRTDLEALARSVGAADLCSAGVRAPHIRQRIFWVAYANGRIAGDGELQSGGQHGQQPQDHCPGCGLVHPEDGDGRGEQQARGTRRRRCGFAGASSLGWWGDDFIQCSDGKARRIEPGIFPLADGVPARVAKQRGAGNAINPILTAHFIQAAEEAVTAIR
jgi:DNA (cytosine-5)-methyltransferase 1